MQDNSSHHQTNLSGEINHHHQQHNPHNPGHSHNKQSSQHDISGDQSKPPSVNSNHTDKQDGMYMRKLQLMQKAQQNGDNQNNILRVDTASKIQQKIQLNTAITVSNGKGDPKWEELIISGRNIQNRSDFTAVIYNDAMYVYGGYEINSGILSDLHKIDLSAGIYSWDKITPKNPKKSPGKLCRHSGVIYNNKMYLFGGQYQGQMNTNTMHSFDFSTNTWEQINYSGQIVPPCIDSHRAIVYKDSMIIISGYLGENGVFSDYVLSFDFLTKSWKILYQFSQQNKPAFKQRIGTDICLYQDRIFLFGGYDGYERLNDLFYFDLKNQTWNPLKISNSSSSFFPKTRKGHSLTLYGDYLVLFGGIHDVTWELDDLYAFDLKNNSWIQIDEDSARRKDYQNIGDISPVKQKSTGQRGSFKRSTTFQATQRQKSLLLSSPLKTQNSAFSPNNNNHNNSASLQRKSLNRGVQSMVINDPYYIKAESADQPHSPTRNLETQKKKEFFQKKAEMLAQLQTEEDEDDKMRNNSNSPTSEAMKNALMTIGNPMPELKGGKKGKTTDFGRTTFSKFLEPIKCPQNSRVGKKPCARDGHAACLYKNKLFIFGGDRHKMSFNDMFALDLDKCLNQISTNQL